MWRYRIFGIGGLTVMAFIYALRVSVIVRVCFANKNTDH